MGPSWAFDGLWQVPLGELGPDLVPWRLDFLQSRYGGLAAAIVTLGWVSIAIVEANRRRTVDPRLYSSKSLESSSSKSVNVEAGRSSEVRAGTALTKSDCAFPLTNISTPGSSGVMGVMACCGAVSICFIGGLSVEVSDKDLP